MRLRGALVVAVLCWPTWSLAQSDAIADKLFRDAQDAMTAGRYDEACRKFDESNRIDPQLGTLLNLAACREKQGKLASAWTTYNRLVDLATKAGDTRRADYAKRRVAALEPQIAQLAIRAPRGVRVSGVLLDGESVGAAVLETTIPVDPGEHTIALVSGSAKTNKVVRVATGTVEVQLSAPVEPATTTTTTTTPSPLRPIGLVVGGVGFVALAAGAVFGAIAIADRNVVGDHCNPLCPAQTIADAGNEGHGMALASTIGFIAGGALLVAGVTLFLIGNSAHPHAAARLAPSLRGLGVRW